MSIPDAYLANPSQGSTKVVHVEVIPSDAGKLERKSQKRRTPGLVEQNSIQTRMLTSKQTPKQTKAKKKNKTKLKLENTILRTTDKRFPYMQ
ncbi:hypothetical protein MA16_Dca000782 [Dendrobium catenatum]|uniref:Uncharacterized protein n=1 Tax=Dendrobium catenatum TaxID=906689 RepID=A0A2I0WUV6_9ASPA|nr:hypothetical protein MA16_Dca000782 [Dendrobium catenatum]